MGGKVVRHESEDTTQVRCHLDVWQVFQNARWHTYFERLQVFDEVVTVEFALNLDENYSRFHGLDILVTKEIISTVNGLPQGGRQRFAQKSTLTEYSKPYLHTGETMVQNGKGYDRKSLPHPWAESHTLWCDTLLVKVGSLPCSNTNLNFLHAFKSVVCILWICHISYGITFS